MIRRLMYVEKCTGTNHDGPAWIGYVEFSRSGKTAYFNGRAFSSGKGIAHCLETGEPHWISGVKKRGSNRHVFGHGKVLISRDAMPEFLTLKGWEVLDETNYGLFDAAATDIQKFNSLLNAKEIEGDLDV